MLVVYPLELKLSSTGFELRQRMAVWTQTGAPCCRVALLPALRWSSRRGADHGESYGASRYTCALPLRQRSPAGKPTTQQRSCSLREPKAMPALWSPGIRQRCRRLTTACGPFERRLLSGRFCHLCAVSRRPIGPPTRAARLGRRGTAATSFAFVSHRGVAVLGAR